MVLLYDFGNGDFEFEPSFEETREALKDIMEDYSREQLIDILDREEYKDCTKEELVEIVLDSNIEECFEYDLWDYFEEFARSDYEENLEYQRDMYGYYGLRESDFH